ncbi:MAG: hypothetical protein DMG45_10645 [Acidobacteria bacterium]|nr:MAG: hypothetical protein DMG45_10645 [Acidobacteriota bacterium]
MRAAGSGDSRQIFAPQQQEIAVKRALGPTGFRNCDGVAQEIVLLRIPLAIVVRAVLHARVVYAASAKCRDGHAIELGREGWCYGAEIQEEVHFVVHSPL